MLVSDEDIMSSVSAGDTHAFAELYDRHAARLFGLVIHIMGTREHAEDVLQEAFIKAWRSARSYDATRSSPGVWLQMITRSTAIDWLRQQRRTPVAASLTNRVSGEISTSFVDPSTVREFGASAAIDRLPSEQRQAILLSFHRGLTHTQIAAVQDAPVGTVKTRIHLGMRRLRDMLRPDSVAKEVSAG